MRMLAVVVVVVALSGCVTDQIQPATRSEFRPRSAVVKSRPRLVERATIAYDGDIASLKAVGGEDLGMFVIQGNSAADAHDLRERAMVEAASYGATHVLIAGERTHSETVAVSGPTAVTRRAGYFIVTDVTPGRNETINTSTGGYEAIRVPPEQWASLPDGLRPTPRVVKPASVVADDGCTPSLTPGWSELSAAEKRDRMRICMDKAFKY